MRTNQELKSKEFRTDLSRLHKTLEKEGIKHVYRLHPVYEKEGKQVIESIGYSPVGTHQILIDKFSIIRGGASFGDYEIYDGKDIERFKTIPELVEFLKTVWGGER